MMKLIKMASVSVLIFYSLGLITSCGGAGGTSDESVGEPSAPVNSQMLTDGNNDTEETDSDPAGATNEYIGEDQTSDNVSTTNIISREDFLFRGILTLQIQVSIESLKYRRAYINICHQDKEGNLQYDNCLLNAPLKNGQISTGIALANDINKLGMTIWQYSTDDEPMEYSWARNETMQWSVEG